MKPAPQKLEGLFPAAHTPFDSQGELFLPAIEKLAHRYLETGVSGVFVAGTTGECHSLSMDERIDMARRWADVCSGTNLRLVIHVGHNSQPEARLLARQAGELGADAIAVMAPSYFKPKCVDDLIDYCEPLARAAGETPFYFYDIPSMTSVTLSMDEFLSRGRERIPTLCGLKYSNYDLAQMQRCVALDGGRFNVLFGCDESLLAGLSLGACGAVGATYNFAARLHLRIVDAFRANDMEAARCEQQDSVALVELLFRYGFLAASKRLMAMTGIDCGHVRSPLTTLTEEAERSLHAELEKCDVLDYPIAAGASALKIAPASSGAVAN